MPLSTDPLALLDAVGAGDRRALARLLTIVEEGRDGAAEVLRAAHARGGSAHRIGLTGAPGAGKSSLADHLVTRLRARGEEIAVLAVDPTSPFSGGAVLGDRVRMQDHVLDPGVYIRSMASRGHLGGLSAAAPKALAVMDAAGFPTLLIETVGVGQDEVEIAATADTVLVVVTPGWGDGIQAAKAGILEIGDVFVVNKADRVGVDDAVSDLRHMLALAESPDWEPPIVPTVAATGEGIDDLLAAVEAHRTHLGDSGMEERRRRRRRAELEAALMERLRHRATEAADASKLTDAVVAGDRDPWSAADEILKETT
jgi:LAO/AO transport system kinase